MQFSLTTQDEPEILINPEDLPNFRLSKEIELPDEANRESAGFEVARNFLIELEKALKENKPDELFYLYDRKFNKISETFFKNSAWPTPQDIEEANEDLEFSMNTQSLYNELCYRHIFARIPNFEPRTRIDSYVNYMDIFDTILDPREDIPIPVAWVWDICDEFLYQFQSFCQFRAKMKEGDETLDVFLKEIDNVWTLESVSNIFKSLIDKSKIIKNGKLEDPLPTYRSLQYFGYYSIVCLLRLNVLICDYDAALKAIEPIEFKKLGLFAKAFPCLMTLFYHAALAYLMRKKYRESVKLFELIISCFIKYKQFYSKSFQFEAMNRQAEKSLALLGIALVFYPTNIDETVLANLKEKFSDKLEKIQKYDLSTFNESFTYGVPKLIVPIKNQEHFKNYGYGLDVMETVIQQREILSQEFSKIQQLNNLIGVLKLYESIKLEKLAKVLKITQDDLKALIAGYQERNNASLKDCPFEQTIIKKILESVKSLDFVIDGGNVKVNSTSSKPNFSKIFYRNMHKIDEITRDIETL